LVGGEKHVRALAGGNDEYIGDIRLGVCGIQGYNCELVICNLEEKVVIECSVDHSEQVGLSMLHSQLVYI
jgi:hypothetical protein